MYFLHSSSRCFSVIVTASIKFGWFRLTLHKVDVSYVGVTQSESGKNSFYPSTFVMR